MRKVDPNTGEIQHCCLGVFLDVLKREVEDIEKASLDHIMLEHSVLPGATWRKLGMLSGGAMIKGSDNRDNPCGRTLAAMNDGGWSFSAIADFIDDNAHLLFDELVEDVKAKAPPRSRTTVARTRSGQLVLE